MAVPSIFSPLEWGDSLLVDGSLLNNLPVDVARNMGADIVIVSTVGNPNKERNEIRSAIDVLSQSFNILRDKTMNTNVGDADILIDTKLSGLGPADSVNKKLIQIISAGEKEAQRKAPQLLGLKNRYHPRSNRFYQQSQMPDSAARVVEIRFTW